MTWRELMIATDGTHHLREGVPAYEMRFDAVLKFHAPGLAPVQRGKEAWHIHWDGQPAYARRFCRTFGFYEGLAAVSDAAEWHHVNPSGSDAYPQRYAWCGNFQERRCAVRTQDDAYLHIRPDGGPAYLERWRYAGDYRDGIAVIQGADGRSTHIDLEGHRLHNRWFLDLDVFHKGLARARDERGWTHIDPSGVPRYARRFAAVEPFYNGQARVECLDGGLEVIDEQGKPLVVLRAGLRSESPVGPTNEARGEPPNDADLEPRSEFAALSDDMVGFWRTQAIAAAVALGVFEALPGSSAEVAERCALIPARGHRLLRALEELALTDNAAGSWQLTARGQYLRSDHPRSLAAAALEYGHHFTRMWGDLPAALQKGGAWCKPAIFEVVAQDEGRRVSHHRMLRSYARHDYPSVAAALPLDGRETVVDAGGGLGVMATMLLDLHLELQVIVLDRPEVIAQAQDLVPTRTGLSWRAGDLFKPWGVEAEAVVLARVLHDWDDPTALRILRRARDILAPGDRLFVIELLLADDDPSGSLCDLHLLMATGGQERSAPAYARLLEEAGFDLHEVRVLPSIPSVLVGVAR